MNGNMGKHTVPGLLVLTLLFLAACGGGGGGEGPTTVNTQPSSAPDLIISALSTTTAAVAPGKTITISNTVKNQGGLSILAFYIVFHLSTNAIYGDEDDIAFAATRLVKSLAAGESSSATTTLTVPSTTPLGSYVVCAKADYWNVVAESDETNNTRCLFSLTIQVENILVAHGKVPVPGDGFGFFVKKFSDNWENPGNPRQDGIPDLINSQSEGAGGGAVNVYSGKTLSLIFRIDGTGFSYPVDAGDLNGDGVPDLFVGDSTAGTARAYSGLDGSSFPGLTFNSDGVNDGFGVSVAAIGDITGDGIPDLIVGAPGGNYVVLYSGADGSRIRRIDSPDGNDNFGMSVSGAGDVNGDETPDLIVGAPLASPGEMDAAGSAFVFSGRRDASGDFPILYRLNGEHADDHFGGCCGAVDSVGDLNGDGKTDLAVAAYAASPDGKASAGSIYLFDGATGTPLQRPDGLGPMRFDGEAPGDRLGGSLCGCGWISKMGDLNGDGDPDFMAGASGADIGDQADAGRVLIFSGYDASVLSRIDNPDPDFIPHYFGVSGANLGDLNGDGRIEINIGAGELGGGEPGVAYLISLDVIPKIQVTRPDLIITAVSPSADTINAGATFSVTDTVKNQGLLAAGAFRIGYRLSPTPSYDDAGAVAITTTRSVASLAAGASSNATITLAIPSTTPAGSYYVCAKADNGNTVAESDETNNTRCTATTITVPPPDLVMTALSTTATSVAQGGSFSLSNTVENQGGVSAGSFTIAFHLSANTTYGDGDDIAFTATRTVSSLGVGKSNTASKTLTVPSTTPAGSYYVCAMADSLNAVVETDEGNNTLCSGVTVTVQ